MTSSVKIHDGYLDGTVRVAVTDSGGGRFPFSPWVKIRFPDGEEYKIRAGDTISMKVHFDFKDIQR